MKKRSKQSKFIIIIYRSWSFSSYSFQVQVSGKQNWLTEWQNKHRTVETETYLSYSPLVLHPPKHTPDNLVIPLGNKHSKVIHLYHSRHPSSSSSFITSGFIRTRTSGLSREAVILPASLKEIHTSFHAVSPTPYAVSGKQLGYYWSGVIYLRLAFV